MAQRPGGGVNLGMILIVLLGLFIVEGIIDVFGLPFDEFLVPTEIIGDLATVLMLAFVSGITGVNTTRRLK